MHPRDPRLKDCVFAVRDRRGLVFGRAVCLDQVCLTNLGAAVILGADATLETGAGATGETDVGATVET